jgi:Protein of unknown function (DUF3078)
MKQTLFSLLLSTLLGTATFGQVADSMRRDTTYWQKSFTGGINYNQASFSNWSGGGVNSLAVGLVVAGRALYVKGKDSWDNTADLQLGYVNQAGVQRKAADQIFLNSVYGYAISPKRDLFASATFNTFFAPGYRYDKLPADQTRLKVSNFFAPAQLTFAWGMSFKPKEWLAIRVSPFAPRFTFMMDESVRVRQLANGNYVQDATQKAFGVEAGKTVRTEWLAFQLQAQVNRNIGSNLSLNARYQLYANYQELENINHRLDLILSAKVNRYISTTFGLIALYNKDFSDNLQIQQTLAIGLLYNVSTFRKK